jgi:hypothetical protein
MHLKIEFLVESVLSGLGWRLFHVFRRKSLIRNKTAAPRLVVDNHFTERHLVDQQISAQLTG